MVHLLMLGVVSHSIIVWGQHFADALLRSRCPSSRAWQTRRLMLLHAGILLLVVAIPARWWWPTLAGAVAVGAAVAWHGVDLARQVRRALPTRFRFSVLYYLAACACLPVGAGLGAALGYEETGHFQSQTTHARLVVAHTSLNLLGWVGLTVLGTLALLWPTMLRTQLIDGVERWTRRALPVLAAGVSTTALAPALNLRALAVAGLAVYLLAALAVIGQLGRLAWRKPPGHFSTLSVGAGMLWLLTGLAWALLRSVTSPGWEEMAEHYAGLTVSLVVGFAVQVLFGALSYLLPSVLGGGPTLVRAGLARTGRWGLGRVLVVNLGLVVCLAPVPSWVRVTCSLLVFVALAAFLPLALRAIVAGIRAKRAAAALEDPRDTPPSPIPERPSWGQALAAVLALALAAGLGVALDPAAAGLGTRPSSNATPTGHTTTVAITMRNMRFEPAEVLVPLGDRLVLEVVNADPGQVHDLVLQGGTTSGRLGPGQRARVDAGVVSADLDGWCSVAGHRQMGMVLRVRTVGPGQAAAPSATPHAMPMPHSMPGDPATTDPTAALGPAREASLPPPPESRLHQITLPVTEQTMEVAPGVRQQRWTFGGTAPGPLLHGRVGDRFEITLINNGTMGHSVDFHAGALAPDEPMRTIAPGETLTYRFTATRAGIWMYHCSTMPMALHIANGMFSAVIIDPPELDPVAREYVLVQSEVYPGTEQTGSDYAAVTGEHPRFVVFNGTADQYAAHPLPVPVGQRVRVWVLNAGPNRGSAFHVVGGQFDTVYKEGAYLLRRGGPSGVGGSQVLDLAPAQGGFVELTFPEAGHYPFVSHLMVDAERGAHGILEAR